MALDFDLACTKELSEYDAEQQKQLIETLATGAVLSALSQAVPHK